MLSSELVCYALAAKKHGVHANIDQLKREMNLDSRQITNATLVDIARTSGLKAVSKRFSWNALQSGTDIFPVILRLKNNDCVLLAGFRKDGSTVEAIILDPINNKDDLQYIGKKDFNRLTRGDAVLLRKPSLADEENQDEQFGAMWFFKQGFAQGNFFLYIALFSVVLQGVTFLTPMFFSIVLDKVISTGGYETLHVLFGGIIMALVFNAIISYLRSTLLLYATGKMDIRLAQLSFGKLMSLPLGYFHKNAAGVINKHISQGGRIREFFTGELLLTLIECLAVVIFLPVLYLYSPDLTLVVIGFTSLIGLNVFLTSKLYKKKLTTLYEAEAGKQALLYESIAGIETVKATSVEPRLQRSWLEKYAETVRLQFSVTKYRSITSEISGFLQKLMVVTIVWFGAQLVLDNQISIGALIAFNMLSARVSGPLVALVNLATRFQETVINIKMLAGVLNSKSEKQQKRGVTPAIAGWISMENVAFRYDEKGPLVLDGLTFDIDAGEKIGVVGRSGSGKSTLIKLLQAFYTANDGTVRVDGFDLQEFDLRYYRANLASVPQQSFIFRGTVFDNIAMARPDASLEQVIEAAELAGARDFIEKLPQGYETMLEEGASNLSGGQRQRLAIARALLIEPKILLLDEATSALDPESEDIIRQQFDKIAKGKTVINVSHRLNMLIGMDRIMVMDNGQVVAFDTHERLLQNNAIYADLWYRQNPQLKQQA